MKILVTGGAGFIGSNIADFYIKAGHRVWIIDNESSGKRKNIPPRATYFKADVQNKHQLEKIFRKGKFDVVNHHAAQIDVRASVADPAFDAKVNIVGLLNVLSLSVETGVKKIIFSSSGGTVYGECPRPAKESSLERPLSPYGVAKLASEKYILAFHALHRLNYTIFRYSNVFGPRQDPHGEAGVVAIFSQKMLRNEPVVIYGPGLQIRDFVYVEDVARANVLALSKGQNQILNIGTGVETSIKNLEREIAAATGYSLRPKFAPKRNGELQKSLLDAGKAKRILGWSPKVSLRNGLVRTVEYFKNSLLR